MDGWPTSNRTTTTVAMLKPPTTPRSVVAHRGNRTVRPLDYRNQKYGHSLRARKCYNRRARQACAPGCRFREWSEKHQVGMPMPITVAQVPLLGHHVAHRAWFRRRQFLLVQSGFD